MRCAFFLALLISIPFVTGLSITEVMYNPPGQDNNLEYIEVYSEEEINLSEYILEDSSSTDSLRLVSFADSTYYLIVEDGFNHTGINATIYTAGSSLGNNLNNEQDVIMLRHGQDIIDIFSYISEMGGNGNGKALCKQETIIECDPTPGYSHIINDTQHEDNVSGDTSYEGIRINEFLPNPHGLDSDTLPDGEWAELYNEGNTIDANGLELCDAAWNCITISSATTGKDTLVLRESYLVIYFNGKSILNNNGDTLRLIHEEEIIDEIFYTESVEGLSWSLIDEEWATGKATPGMSNSGVQGKKNIQEESRVLIKDVQVKNKKDAVVLDVHLSVFKGETKQKNVVLFVENATEKTTLQFLEEDQLYELIVPLRFDQDCSSQRHRVIAEGFGKHASHSFLINQTCKKNMLIPAKSAPALESIIKSNQSLQNIPPTGSVIYASAHGKIKEYSIYGFLLLVILLTGYFLFARQDP